MTYHIDGSEEFDGEVNTDTVQWKHEGSDNKMVFNSNPLLRLGFMQTLSIFKPTNVSLRRETSSSHTYGNGSDEDNDDIYDSPLTDEQISTLTDGDPNNFVEITHSYSKTDSATSGEDFDYTNTAKNTLIVGTAKDVSSKEQKAISLVVNQKKLTNHSICVVDEGSPPNVYYTDPTTGGSESNFPLVCAVHSPAYFNWVGPESNVANADTGLTFEHYWYEIISYDKDSAWELYNPNTPFSVNQTTVSSNNSREHYNFPLFLYQSLRNEARIHLIHRYRASTINDSSSSSYTAGCEITFKIAEMDCKSAIDIEAPMSKDFYINAKGRVGSGTTALRNPIAIIRNILESELGYINFDEDDYQLALDQHSDMYLALQCMINR